jgi:hypothetical protein
LMLSTLFTALFLKLKFGVSAAFLNVAASIL